MYCNQAFKKSTYANEPIVCHKCFFAVFNHLSSDWEEWMLHIPNRRTLGFGLQLVDIFFKLAFDHRHARPVDHLHAVTLSDDSRRTAFL